MMSGSFEIQCKSGSEESIRRVVGDALQYYKDHSLVMDPGIQITIIDGPQGSNLKINLTAAGDASDFAEIGEKIQVALLNAGLLFP